MADTSSCGVGVLTRVFSAGAAACGMYIVQYAYAPPAASNSTITIAMAQTGLMPDCATGILGVCGVIGAGAGVGAGTGAMGAGVGAVGMGVGCGCACPEPVEGGVGLVGGIKVK